MPDQTQPQIEMFMWKGQKRYRCPLNWESGAKCMYDTYSIEELHQHMLKGGHSRLVQKDPNASMQVSSLSHSETTSLPVDEEFKNIEFQPDTEK
jgi:hypothetical protein